MYDINLPKSMNLPVYNTALSTYDGSQRFRQLHSNINILRYATSLETYSKCFIIFQFVGT